MMAFNNILLDEIEPDIYRLTVNRPRAFNALNSETLSEILAAGEHIASIKAARVLLVTGAGGKAFVAGADIQEMQQMSALESEQFSQLGMRAFRRLETLPIPVIAVINGFCLGGGCELAMSCDWMIASERAKFGQPEVNLGVTPGFGATQRLPRLIGRARAMELLVTGRQLSAEEALQWGLVNQLHPVDQLDSAALELAKMIQTKGPVAVRLAKQLVQRGQDLDLENACLMESQSFGLTFSTEDQKEGMNAFLEKRNPIYKGH
ncbi:MAG: enoyl-CoA hydratase/isomerase family protein [Gammaproteobacteria bacterium]|nr:enoyl-CoA hydratase/isomerase family protein [Gammaproteobacteria bacterium]